MSHSVDIDFPELTGDPAEPANIPEVGPVTQIGKVVLQWAEVNDPEYPSAKRVAENVKKDLPKKLKTKNKSVDGMFDSALRAQKHLLDKGAEAYDELLADGPAGDPPTYSLVHNEWWREVSILPALGAGESQETSTTYIVGSSKKTGVDTTETVGTEFGVSGGYSSETTAKAGLDYKIVQASVESKVKIEAKVWAQRMKTLQISESSEEFVTNQEESTEVKTVQGLDTGARYVTWQLVHQVQLIRDTDNKVISDIQVNGHVESKRYAYGASS